MAKEKEVKTNAMRMLDKLKLPYKVHLYECDEFIDGVHIAELLGESCDSCFKTLVTVGQKRELLRFRPARRQGARHEKVRPRSRREIRLWKWCMSMISTS